MRSIENHKCRYMLTEEGKEVARECLLRSELLDPNKNLDSLNDVPDLDQRDKSIVDSTKVVLSDMGLDNDALVKKVALPSADSKKQKKSIDVPSEYLDKFVRMGFSEQQILRAFAEVSETSPSREMSAIWPTVLCRLREDEVYGQVSHSARENRLMNASPIVASNNQKFSVLPDPGKGFCTLKACSSADCVVEKQGIQGSESKQNVLAMPPLKFGEKFGDVYGVILILDSREQFATQGSRSRKIIEKVCAEFKIQIEVRMLPVGDGIWIARHKYDGSEYVLDFIVERKKVDDLRLSIRDNRYRDQKLRLLRCGLKKMIYLVEGDPNSSEAAESIKTACFTTEILEGFDVQRTSGLADTLRKYGYLTQSIDKYYSSLDSGPGLCLPFDVFIKSCEELDKMTVTDVFAVQLMQVPHVTETIALAVLDMYPTLISLARAYSLLDGDVSAQEEMLKRQSNDLISGPASRNIFQLVWGK
ncbi:crossover junction endonuclease MUS81 [Olea europaea subsp. europaea]|uniref:Crossover junction endonuclease MUS81 n=1 Tax=Olea europaea subsp. europaea TaxID=158383 RepID=A0A8S0PI44_OLEEU|nr:crossover junction endonuclease MUS81 [Olea europaea subsp. europaea]